MDDCYYGIPRFDSDFDDPVNPNISLLFVYEYITRRITMDTSIESVRAAREFHSQQMRKRNARIRNFLFDTQEQSDDQHWDTQTNDKEIENSPTHDPNQDSYEIKTKYSEQQQQQQQKEIPRINSTQIGFQSALDYSIGFVTIALGVFLGYVLWSDIYSSDSMNP